MSRTFGGYHGHFGDDSTDIWVRLGEDVTNIWGLSQTFRTSRMAVTDVITDIHLGEDSEMFFAIERSRSANVTDFLIKVRDIFVGIPAQYFVMINIVFIKNFWLKH